MKDFSQQLGIAHGGQCGHVLHAEPGQAAGLGQHRAHLPRVLARRCRQYAADFAFIHKSQGVVHVYSLYPTSFPVVAADRCTVKVVPTSG